MPKVIIPRGYLWLREVAQDFKWKYLEIKRQYKNINQSNDDWEHELSIESAAKLQLALVNLDLEAMYFGEEDIEKLPRGFWAKDVGDEVIRNGVVTYKRHDKVPVFLEIASYQKFVSEYQVLAQNLGINFEEQKDAVPSPYITPFVEIIIRAISTHGISENYAPPVKQLENWFRKQSLPDDKPISPNQAKMMATFSRPPHLMRGGHFKVGKPSGS